MVVTSAAMLAAIVKEADAEKIAWKQVGFLLFALIGALVLGLLKVSSSSHKDASDAKAETPDDIRGALHVLHRVVAHHKGLTDPQEGWLRITLHRAFEQKVGKTVQERLEQSVAYVGSDESGRGPSRPSWSFSEGLIGKVARLKSPRKFDRPADMTDSEWTTHLVDNLGMSRDAARATREGRFSFLGIPIKSPGGGEVLGVVYADTEEREFFDRETTALVVAGCEGVAKWIHERYP